MIGALWLALAAPASACGPFFDEAVYTWHFRPSEPWAEVVKDAGLPDPGWWSAFQPVIWRQLHEKPISEAEGREFAAAWDQLLAAPAAPAAERWVEARQGWPDPPARSYLQTARQIPGAYHHYENCLPDAFDTALQTAEARRSSLSAGDFRAWVLAQDQVFAACGDPDAPEPPALPKDADPALRQDRAWQQAAWSFYQGRYDEAEARYTAIAGSRSPWAARAGLVLARIALRRHSLQGADTLDLADARLDAVLKDRKAADLHASAARLKRLVQSRREGIEASLDRVADRIESGQTAAQDVVDLSVMLDRYLASVMTYDEDGERVIDPIYRMRLDSRMLRWIISYHWGIPDSNWADPSDKIWLLAQARKHPMRDQSTYDAAEQAQQLPEGHPIKIAMSLPLIQYEISSSEYEQARARIDRLLDADPPQSARIRLLRERVRVAESLGKLLEIAWQKPLAYGYQEFSYEYVEDPSLGPALLPEAAAILNSRVPLPLLQVIADHPLTPATHRAPLQRAVLARAVVLGDDGAIQGAAAGLARLDPEAAWLQQDLSAAPDAPTRRAIGALYILRNPGVSWAVAPDYGRGLPIQEIDDYRRNWWDGSAPESLPLAFITRADSDRADAEHNALKAAGPAGDALGAFLLPWLREHPQAPFAAEILHHLVRATRYTVEGQGKTSQAAFALLHRAYPKSDWAAKTPYWFK